MAELEKLRQAQQSCCRLEIGELIRVRGTVKTSRQQREIMASVFCECVNVTHNAQHMCAHYLNYLHIHRVCLALCVFPDKVNDPMMAVQIVRMMEIPQLYRQFYDKPLPLQSVTTGY